MLLLTLTLSEYVSGSSSKLQNLGTDSDLTRLVISGTRTGKEVGVRALGLTWGTLRLVSEVTHGGDSLPVRDMAELGIRAGADIFRSVVHWFQYLKAMGLEAFSTDLGEGDGAGGFFTGGGSWGPPAKYPAFWIHNGFIGYHQKCLLLPLEECWPYTLSTSFPWWAPSSVLHPDPDCHYVATEASWLQQQDVSVRMI